MMSFLKSARRSSFTFASSTGDYGYGAGPSHISLLTHIRSLSTARQLAVVSTFIVGFTLTVIMKREHLLWLAASTAGATPLLQFGQGGTFDYPGLRFGADKKFSITVFSDLHLGERWCTRASISRHENLLTIFSGMGRSRKGPWCRLEDHRGHEFGSE